MPKPSTTLEIRSKFVELGLSTFVGGKVFWEGDHVRLVLSIKDSRGISDPLVREVSARLRKIGCRCILDEAVHDRHVAKVAPLSCCNRFESLPHASAGVEVLDDRPDVDLDFISSKINTLKKSSREKRLRVATWNFSGLCSGIIVSKLIGI